MTPGTSLTSPSADDPAPIDVPRPVAVAAPVTTGAHGKNTIPFKKNLYRSRLAAVPLASAKED